MFAALVIAPLLASASNGVVAVPEPGALSLMLIGLAVIGAIKLKNKFRK